MKKNSIVSIMVERKKEKLKALKKPFNPKPLPKPKSIKTLERGYFSEIKKIYEVAKSLVDSILIKKLVYIQNLRDSSRPSLDSMTSFKHDSWVDEITKTMESIKVQYQQVITIPKIKTIAESQAKKINRANHVAFEKGLEKVLAIPPIRIEAWLGEEIKAFTKANVDLITSIPSQYFEQVEQTVSRMVQQGKTTKDITAAIKRRYDVNESRAALIARDQTNKFNGSLTQLRNTEVGITQYQWSTSGDDRVRPDHAEREGEVFSWDDPPEDGHPGEAINCRCTALGIIGDVE